MTTPPPFSFYALVAVLVALAAWSGCASQAARGVVQAQTPGSSTGAGATLTGPNNSAAASSQVAERHVAFHAPVEVRLPQVSMPGVNVDLPQLSPAPIVAPAWIHERTETKLGQHQDAAGIVKVAVSMSAWGTVKWIGLMLLVLGVGGLLWSHNNEASGYPLVFVQLTAAGALLIFFAENPLWLLLLVPPLALYAVQKFNLLRL